MILNHIIIYCTRTHFTILYHNRIAYRPPYYSIERYDMLENRRVEKRQALNVQAEQGKALYSKYRQGIARHDRARHCEARQGRAQQSRTGQGIAKQGAGRTLHGRARLDANSIIL